MSASFNCNLELPSRVLIVRPSSRPGRGEHTSCNKFRKKQCWGEPLPTPLEEDSTPHNTFEMAFNTTLPQLLLGQKWCLRAGPNRLTMCHCIHHPAPLTDLLLTLWCRNCQS